MTGGATDTMLAGLRGVAGVFSAASAGVWPLGKGGETGNSGGGPTRRPRRPRKRLPPDSTAPPCAPLSVPSLPPLPSLHNTPTTWTGARHDGANSHIVVRSVGHAGPCTLEDSRRPPACHACAGHGTGGPRAVPLGCCRVGRRLIGLVTALLTDSLSGKAHRTP